MIGIDTNVLVRALANDHPEQSAAAQDLLRANLIWIPITVLLEAEWVLRSQLRFDRDRVVTAFEGLVRRSTVTVQHLDDVCAALSLAGRGMDFADALHLALSKDCDEFVSFDRRLVKAAGPIGPTPVRLP